MKPVDSPIHRFNPLTRHKPSPAAAKAWIPLTGGLAEAHIHGMSMATVEELQKHLETYLAEVAQGHEVLISRDDRPVARLAPLEESAWYSISAQGLARAYGEGEPDYSAVLLKEANPEYRP